MDSRSLFSTVFNNGIFGIDFAGDLYFDPCGKLVSSALLELMRGEYGSFYIGPTGRIYFDSARYADYCKLAHDHDVGEVA